MKDQLKVSIEIDAPLRETWQGLTDPALIKQYFFGTQVETTWEKHAPIYFRGEYNGQKYEDKGVIMNILPEQHVSYTYWSSMSGMPDVPENYMAVIYDLRPVHDHPEKTEVTVTQETSPEKKDHSASNWKMILDGLKKVVESL